MSDETTKRLEMRARALLVKCAKLCTPHDGQPAPIRDGRINPDQREAMLVELRKHERALLAILQELERRGEL